MDSRMPTMGAVALGILLDTYPEAEIILAGFSYSQTMQTKETHDWDAEKEWVMKLAKEQRVRIIK